MERDKIKPQPAPHRYDHIDYYFGFFPCKFSTFAIVLICMVAVFWWTTLSMWVVGRISWLTVLLVGVGLAVSFAAVFLMNLPPKEPPQIPPAKDPDARLS